MSLTQITDQFAQGREAWRSWVHHTGSPYWGDGGAAVLAQSIPRATELKPGTTKVQLPDWAESIGVDKPAYLLVPSSAIIDGDGSDYQRCDWWAAAYLYLVGYPERNAAADDESHSYAYRLKGVDPLVFDYAWVNRIYLLLRRIVARQHEVDEGQLFGPLPSAKFDITHDVDAVRLTPEIRVKAAAFRAFNAMRDLAGLRFSDSVSGATQALNVIFSPPCAWPLERLRKLEESAGIRSTLHVYGGPAGISRASPKSILLDPAYDIHSEPMRSDLRSLSNQGWTIGLHGSYASFTDANSLQRERENLAQCVQADIRRSRQHWLRFNWNKTWQAQLAAGLSLDSTLGFNDRPGFRNSAALKFNPWDAGAGKAMDIQALPMVLMDSHFYDYQRMTREQRYAQLLRWVTEVRMVHGQASLNWHSHTLFPMFAWEEGYQDLMAIVAGPHG